MVASLDTTARRILEHVFRYRLTTAQIVAGCRKLEIGNEDLAETKLNELASTGWLQDGLLTPLLPSSRYFFLSTKAAHALGHDTVVAREPSREMRIESYAIARFCCCQTPFRELFTKEEFVSRFSSIWYPGQPVRYYLEPTGSGSARLAFLKVDKGGPSRWDRIVESGRRFLAKRTTRSATDPRYHRQVDAFCQLVDAGKFQLSLLTSLPEKAQAIRQALDLLESSGQDRPPIVSYVVDGLFDLLHPKTAR